jgi:hypothetical protein
MVDTFEELSSATARSLEPTSLVLMVESVGSFCDMIMGTR